MTRVLFVDDDPLALETFKKAMQVFGHQAILSTSAEEGLQKAQSENPDVIFIDMRLPDMDGLALARALRAHEITTNIPVLMLSAGPEIDAGEQARQAGVLDYLAKPVRLQTLLDAINKHSR